MKINQANFSLFSIKTFENKKEQNVCYSQFDSFSRDYCNAIKSLNLPFKGGIGEEELKQKCDELKHELIQEGIIKNEDEISWYTEHFANSSNIQIAKKVFTKEDLKNCQRDILKTTNEENLPVVSYICDNPFLLQYAFDILLATKKENAQASLAMCQSEDIPKDIIDKLLPSIKSFNDGAAAKIALCEALPKEHKVRVINKLKPYNSAFIEKLLDDKDFPKDNFYYFVDALKDEEGAKAKIDFYEYLSSNPKNSKKDIHKALMQHSTYAHTVLKEVYAYLEKDGFMDLEHINKATKGTLHEGKATIQIYKLLKAYENLNQDELAEILFEIKMPQMIESGLKYLRRYPNYPQELKKYFLSDSTSLLDAPIIRYDDSLYEGAKEYSAVYKALLSNPELYINGEANSKEEAQKEIEEFTKLNFWDLTNISRLFGKNTTEQLFRKRLDKVEDFILKLQSFESEYEILLEKFLKCKNNDGSEFSTVDKINLVNILTGFNACKIDADEIEQNIKDGKIDLEELQRLLLRETFKFCDMSDEEIDKIAQNKLDQWNLEFASHLAMLCDKMRDGESEISLSDIIKIANSNVSFKDFIQQDNEYGKVNQKTKKLFKKCGLNYDKWLNPPKTCETQFQYIDSNQATLSQIVSQIEEDIEVLRKTPAKSFIDKHFGDCISGDKFKINEKYSKNKQSLEVFTQNMFELLDNNIFKRAEANLENSAKRQNAQTTLTIKNHLEQRLKDIKGCSNSKKEKPIDLTIKMWERNPIHDLFQGNYSTCCIGLGEVNEFAMPIYLLNSTFNMIELIDNSTGETIGNALCYFTTDVLDEPMFVIDNIEIANKHKMSDKASDELLNQIAGYCINLCREVSNRNIKIVMGTSYNDVYDEELSIYEPEIANLLGELDCEEIYIDAFGGWNDGKYNSCEVENEEYKMKLFYLADSLDEDLD